jgi:hypothetical protein
MACVSSLACHKDTDSKLSLDCAPTLCRLELLVFSSDSSANCHHYQFPGALSHVIFLPATDTSVYPPLIYAWFGSSRHIAVGPVAVVSLLVGSLLPKRIDPKLFPTEYLELNFLNTFFVGVIQTALGLLQ